ncbi:hypothetical protein HanIR_Chr16g0795921 [Helianthus annuus]|nr:hypothetical protein HanIR_Chr16g0795921 [Helianthus annuus]
MNLKKLFHLDDYFVWTKTHIFRFFIPDRKIVGCKREQFCFLNFIYLDIYISVFIT